MNRSTRFIDLLVALLLATLGGLLFSACDVIVSAPLLPAPPASTSNNNPSGNTTGNPEQPFGANCRNDITKYTPLPLGPPPLISSVSTLMTGSKIKLNSITDITGANPAITMIGQVISTGLSSGPNSGGTPIIITGQGLRKPFYVEFGPSQSTQISDPLRPCCRITRPAHLAPPSFPGIFDEYGNPNSSSDVRILGIFDDTYSQSDHPQKYYCLTPTSVSSSGKHDIYLTNGDGQKAVLPQGFSYFGPPPELTSITPAHGTRNGGVTTTITGTNFQLGTQILLGSSPCESIDLSATQIVCKTTMSNPGFVDVVITNPDRQTVRAAARYEYSAGTNPPSAFTYPVNPAWYSTNIPIPALSPTPANEGDAVYSISPSLPNDLSFDVTSGAISGTPLKSIPSQVYTVTAINPNGSTSTRLTLGVSDFGNGKSGTRSTTGSTEKLNRYTYVNQANAPAGSATLLVRDPSIFSRGDLVLIIQMQNNGPLYWEFNSVVAIDGTTLSLGSALRENYKSQGAGVVTQILQVPQYSSLTIPENSSVTAPKWQKECSNCGGVIALKISDTLTVNGTLSATGKGFQGGGVGATTSGTAFGRQGESFIGLGSASKIANQGGGGGGELVIGTTNNTQSGGGGSYGTPGTAGATSGHALYGPGAAGALYGISSLYTMLMGSGGGGGAVNTANCPSHVTADGSGGSGGGIIIIYANTIQVGPNGRILARGEDQQPDTHCSGNVGGAGSGGSILLKAYTMNLGAGAVLATGGNLAGYTTGTGGDGRIRLDGNMVTGSTSPDYVGIYPDIPPTGLTYTSPNYYVKGVQIENNIPTLQGGSVDRFTISPSPLPSGLAFENTTGIISGTPTQTTGKLTYSVTATNLNGSFSRDIILGVLDFGDGHDGAATVSTRTNVGNSTAYITNTQLLVGTVTFGVNSAAGFAASDAVLVLQAQGAGSIAGTWEVAKIAATDTTTTPHKITLASPGLVRSYLSGVSNSASSSSVTTLTRIPQFTNVHVSSTGIYEPVPWNAADPASAGGVIAFFANGLTIVQGSIDATGRGFGGGAGKNVLPGNSAQANQGDSWHGKGLPLNSKNDGGGGGGLSTATHPSDQPGGGAGGKDNGTAGISTTTGSVGGAGSFYMPANLMEGLFLGSGGGGGASSQLFACIAANGGSGGGIVFVKTAHLSLSGAIRANGQGGSPGTGACTNGMSGGGSGGSIYLRTLDAVGPTVEANGGAPVGSGGNSGGGGSAGRIRIDSPYPANNLPGAVDFKGEIF